MPATTCSTWPTTALKGDASASLRMLHGLRAEGTEPPVVLWALAREIRTLYEVQLDCDDGPERAAGAGCPTRLARTACP